MKSIHKTAARALAGLAALATWAYTAHANPRKSDAEFAKMDINRDGRVSSDEHAAGGKQMFDAMDANHNGKVTALEMDAAHERVTGAQANRAEMSAAEKIKVIDKDGDGILSAAEHASGSQAMFEKMDTNKDGYLSRVELAAGHANMLKKT
ncbi:MAG: EF-hand domain-containing protein [Betaproteobacteria bacterium]|nr:EF-hand domain-containing protein [Betaproteobacteria bacterium]